MFVVTTDFDGIPYNIPHLVDDEDGLQETLEKFISIKEEEILRKTLGNELYDAWQAGLAVTPTPDAWWTDLSNGKDYNFYSIQYKWEGMKKMLVPFIYSEWLLETVTGTVDGIGVNVPNAENASIVGASNRIVKAWNEFARMAGHDFRMDNSLFGFLTNPDNYDLYKNAQGTFDFCPPSTKNVFSL